jgi:hypothetical protein
MTTSVAGVARAAAPFVGGDRLSHKGHRFLFFILIFFINKLYIFFFIK